MNEQELADKAELDNGPAFPFETETHIYPGMSLRDYFAGQLMPALIRTAPSVMSFGAAHEGNNLTYANVAYSLADAMLRARKENGGG